MRPAFTRKAEPKRATDRTIRNGFTERIHAQATGSGKTSIWPSGSGRPAARTHLHDFVCSPGSRPSGTAKSHMWFFVLLCPTSVLFLRLYACACSGRVCCWSRPPPRTEADPTLADLRSASRAAPRRGLVPHAGPRSRNRARKTGRKITGRGCPPTVGGHTLPVIFCPVFPSFKRDRFPCEKRDRGKTRPGLGRPCGDPLLAQKAPPGFPHWKPEVLSGRVWNPHGSSESQGCFEN